MKLISLNALISLALTGHASASGNTAVDTISIKGNRFVNDRTGKVMLIRGVAYQPTVDGQFRDYITDDREPQWSKDIARFQDLGINCLRIYETDPSEPHDKFMEATAKLGIYVLFDLPNQFNHIDRLRPAYSLELWEYVERKVDVLGKYRNTLGFFAGNEVASEPGKTTAAAAHVKSLIRDLKRYQSKQQRRYIPIGYAAVDDDKFREQEFQYYATCQPSGSGGGGDGQEEDTTVDFYAINVYSWCGPSDMQRSKYDERRLEFAGHGLPVFFSEYGCNTIRPREFGEVHALYTRPMLDTFSGGIVYEYSHETNEYGLVSIDANSGQRQELMDYRNFKLALANVSTSLTAQLSIDQRQRVKNKCPSASKDWLVSGQHSPPPPLPSRKFCECKQRKSTCRYRDNGSVDETELGQHFQVICGLLVEDGKSCDAILNDPLTGRYGELSGCDDATKLSYLYSLYAGNNRQRCDFSGSAEWIDAVRQAASSDGDDDKDCSKYGGDSESGSSPNSIPRFLLLVIICISANIILPFY